MDEGRPAISGGTGGRDGYGDTADAPLFRGVDIARGQIEVRLRNY